MLCLYIASCNESIFVVSGPPARAAVSVTTVSAAATLLFFAAPRLFFCKKGMPLSAHINMKADSSINMMDFVLIIMQAAKLHKLKLKAYQSELFMFYLTFMPGICKRAK